MPERHAEISVQVPARNPGPSFSAFLGSLSAQVAGGPSWELVVVDDGSDIPVGESFDIRPEGASRVEVIRLDGPGNRPRARNVALEASTAPLAFMTDSDLRLGRDVLRRHAEARREGFDGVLRGSRINALSKDASPWQRWFDTRAGGVGGRRGPMPWNHFVTGNVSLPRELAVRAGMFDERITHYGGEDTELGYRMHLAGAAFERDPGMVAWHLDEVTVRRHSAKMHEYGATGLRYTIGKHPDVLGLLGTGWIAPGPGRPGGPLARLAGMAVRAALVRPVYMAVLGWMEKVGAPAFLFTYLSVGACLRGYTGRTM